MSEHFALNAFPYKFIHTCIEEVIIEIELNREPEQENAKLGIKGDFYILKRTIRQWYSSSVHPELRNIKDSDEWQKKLSSIINFDVGKITRISFINENLEWKTIKGLLQSLNEGFNLSNKTINKINVIKILADLSKIDMQEQSLAGVLKNYDFTVNYAKIDEDKTKIVVTVDENLDLNESRQQLSLLVCYISNWYSMYIDSMVKPGAIERKSKIKVDRNVITIIIPGNGINKKNLFFLLSDLNFPRLKVISLDIYSNEKPSLDHMRKYIDFFDQK